MPRYGADFEPRRMGIRNFAEGRGYGRDYGLRPGGRRPRSGQDGEPFESGNANLGGMRSDHARTRWDRFPGEEGWFGQGYAGYPEVDPREGREDRGARSRHRGYDAGYDTFGQSGARQQGFGGFGRGSDAERVRVRDIMTEDPAFVTPTTTVADVARTMRELEVGIIPVVDGKEKRRLRGVITDRDLAVRVLADGKDGKAKVADVMTEQVETVNKNDSVADVFAVMKREKVRRVPVTDRDGRLVGIVAQADLSVDYAGLDLEREVEVEEVIERVSEPARPRNR